MQKHPAILSRSIARIAPIVLAIAILGGRVCSQQQTVNDVSRLNPIAVSGIASPTTEAQIQSLLRQATREHKKIAIAGKRHSQGGQTASPGGLVIDLTHFNQIRSFDEKQRVVTVESGVSWADMQTFANARGLAVEVQQSSNIFTVGGSLSVNCHGRDPNFGTLIHTVRSLRLLLANGHIVTASRTENPELFRGAVGGYGLLGIILTADLELTPDVVYQRTQRVISYQAYPDYFRKNVLGHPEVGLEFAWPAVSRREFLRNLLVVTYRKTDATPAGIFDLNNEERHISRNKLGLAMSRDSRWGKDLRWFIQENFADQESGGVVSRNNAMRPPVRFLEYSSARDTDILQEYFVPIGSFVSFMDRLRVVVQRENVNLLSATIRYVPRDPEPLLSYAAQDSFAIVLYINQGMSSAGRDAASRWTRMLVDAALAEHGSYYLAYQQYPTREQLRQAYPAFDQLLALKAKYDPEEFFSSSFYLHYK